MLGRSKAFSLMIIPVTLINPDDKGICPVETNAILDTGSDSTLLIEELASKLSLKGEAFDLKLRGISNSESVIKSALVNVKIESMGKDFEKTMEEVQIVPSISEVVKAPDWSNYLSKLGISAHDQTETEKLGC